VRSPVRIWAPRLVQKLRTPANTGKTPRKRWGSALAHSPRFSALRWSVRRKSAAAQPESAANPPQRLGRGGAARPHWGRPTAAHFWRLMDALNAALSSGRVDRRSWVHGELPPLAPVGRRHLRRGLRLAPNTTGMESLCGTGSPRSGSMMRAPASASYVEVRLTRGLDYDNRRGEGGDRRSVATEYRHLLRHRCGRLPGVYRGRVKAGTIRKVRLNRGCDGYTQGTCRAVQRRFRAFPSVHRLGALWIT